MDYKDFTNRKLAFDGFVAYRREIYDSVEKGKFYESFTELCTKALSGDCIAQDCVAYFFHKGVPDFLVPNFDFYMSWQILAGANGNAFALEKMEFFLNNAVNRIIYNDQLMQIAFKRKNLNKENALMVISNLVCEGIVDELEINPKDLIRIGDKASLYTPEKNRKYLNAIERCLPVVEAFLAS